MKRDSRTDLVDEVIDWVNNSKIGDSLLIEITQKGREETTDVKLYNDRSGFTFEYGHKLTVDLYPAKACSMVSELLYIIRNTYKSYKTTTISGNKYF